MMLSKCMVALISGFLWLSSEFKVSLRYRRPCLNKTEHWNFVPTGEVLFFTFFWHPGNQWGHIPLQLQCLFLNSNTYWESFEAWLFRDQVRSPEAHGPQFTPLDSEWCDTSCHWVSNFQHEAPSKNRKEIMDMQRPRMGSRASTYHCFFITML